MNKIDFKNQRKEELKKLIDVDVYFLMRSKWEKALLSIDWFISKKAHEYQIWWFDFNLTKEEIWEIYKNILINRSIKIYNKIHDEDKTIELLKKYNLSLNTIFFQRSEFGEWFISNSYKEVVWISMNVLDSNDINIILKWYDEFWEPWKKYYYLEYNLNDLKIDWDKFLFNNEEFKKINWKEWEIIQLDWIKGSYVINNYVRHHSQIFIGWKEEYVYSLWDKETNKDILWDKLVFIFNNNVYLFNQQLNKINLLLTNIKENTIFLEQIEKNRFNDYELNVQKEYKDIYNNNWEKYIWDLILIHQDSKDNRKSFLFHLDKLIYQSENFDEEIKIINTLKWNYFVINNKKNNEISVFLYDQEKITLEYKYNYWSDRKIHSLFFDINKNLMFINYDLKEWNNTKSEIIFKWNLLKIMDWNMNFQKVFEDNGIVQLVKNLNRYSYSFNKEVFEYKLDGDKFIINKLNWEWETILDIVKKDDNFVKRRSENRYAKLFK